jgi:hypothetical protein
MRDSYAEIKARGEESDQHNRNRALRRQNKRASRQNQISSMSEINQLEKMQIGAEELEMQPKDWREWKVDSTRKSTGSQMRTTKMVGAACKTRPEKQVA